MRQRFEIGQKEKSSRESTKKQRSTHSHTQESLKLLKFLWERVSLCNLDYPGPCYADSAGL